MRRTLIVCLGFMALQGCVAPRPAAGSLPPALQKANDLPGDSSLLQARALRRDVLDNVRRYEKDKYQCASMNVLGTDTDPPGKFYVDGRGRLMRGSLTDRWTVEACGRHQALVIVIQSDGKGGNFVAIAEKSP